MSSDEVLALYDWAPGVCFRHPASGETDTTKVTTIQPRRAEAHEVRACRDCILDLEAARQAAVEGAGQVYVPGAAGMAITDSRAGGEGLRDPSSWGESGENQPWGESGGTQ